MEQIISYKKIGLLAFPIIISQSVVLIDGMIDLAFIGPLGTDAIAAVAIANALCATVFNFLEGFRIGTTVLIAKASANNNLPEGTAVINTGLFLTAIIGIVLFIFAPTISNMVYDSVGNEQINYHGVDYLIIWLWTIPLILFSYVFVGLFRGLRDTATPLFSTAAVCILNAFFTYLFVYGGWGFPCLGVKGAAWGTFTANLVGLLIIIYLALKNPLTTQYLRWNHLFFKQAPEYISLAIDIGLNTGFTLLALLAFVYIIKQLGSLALAVHQITLQIFNFAYLPAMGFLITASIVVPGLVGQESEHLLKSTVNRICLISLGMICLTSGSLYLTAPVISRFFSPTDTVVAEQTTQTMTLVCFGQLFSSVYMVLRGALTGCRDTRFIIYEGLISSYIIFLPLAYWVAIRLGYGVYGGYIAFLLWCMTDCLALAVRFYCQQAGGKFHAHQ